ncbi:hypothetical protein NBT05_01010 [Aquimarina sp. ERC-38]|uniref:hypothetical protein n=1 Tax=Aquimarina sp. ERC-38 TaxID=2949996 RepID=UPI0022472ACF|nr:hypothetical protein [Aquimarina sp. ERC-38]UZO81070.1 hypothetical protein NBT05_01010 [Aquimarina sp. ERC-38]
MKAIYKIIFSSILLILICGSCGKEQKVCSTPESVTYTNDVANLVETNCFMCHAPDVYKEKASRNKIYDYKSLKKMGESGQLIGSITHAKGFIAMPYRKNKKIDSCAIEVFKKWVETGMKE